MLKLILISAGSVLAGVAAATAAAIFIARSLEHGDL